MANKEEKSPPNFPGMWLPAGVLFCDELTSHEVLLLVAIGALAANPRGCWAQNDYLAKIVKLAKSTVSGLLKDLHDKGMIHIMRGRNDDGEEERQITLSEKAADLFKAPCTKPLAAEAATPSAGRSPPFGGPKPPLRPAEPYVVDIYKSSLADVREGSPNLSDLVMEAVGNAVDLQQTPQLLMVRELIYLTVDRPNSPACTIEEIVDAASWAAHYMRSRYGPGSIKKWDLVERKAIEFRDKRINGNPVKVIEPRAVEGIGDPVTFDEARWRSVISVSNLRGGDWRDEWGPPPGAPGSFVPAELVELWKGKVDA